MHSSKVSNITANAILVAIEIVLGLISNYFKIGSVNLNLALIPIIIGACLYGVKSGILLGFINGIITIFAPDTLTLFFQHAPIGTIIVCIVKTTFAGLISALVYKLFKRKNGSSKDEMIGSIFASIIVPIINTGLFILIGSLFFEEAYQSIGFDPNNENMILYAIGLVATINFVIEFSLTVVLSPVIYRIIRIEDKIK